MRDRITWALLGCFIVAAGIAADSAATALRGHLRQPAGQNPYIETSDHKHIHLDGDEPTLKVLTDERLKDSEFEVIGRAVAPDRFEVNKIHLPSLFVYREGKRKQVSYWCDVCYIRTTSPGKCWCCQKQTDLDPIDPEP